jgi:uncharacterized membrane protein YoaK (UPF0700 family)
MAQMICLALFMLLGWLAVPDLSHSGPFALSAGMAGAAAMGIQNAGSRLLMHDIAPTTVMTGNVTQLIIDLVDLGRDTDNAAKKDSVRKFLWPVLAFGLGAISGGYVCMQWNFWSLLVPIAALALIAVASVQEKDSA